ncbi:MAG: flavin reductase family protein [Chitinophagaceae bacterium]|nr:MAG: flavin reductase family protein [Chitinophagaceae bacterium]
MTIDLNELPHVQKQRYLQHAIAPRPICFASTIDNNGTVNLSPFSFFNLFSIHPPIVIFSPLRKMRDNSTKHTLDNIREVPEVVINIVDYDMVQQVSLASCEFPKGVDEFVKAGFNSEPATVVRPPMVKESKVKLECVVNEIKEMGTGGGAGNLIICQVIRMHIDDAILDENMMIDQQKFNIVARLGGDWYCRVDKGNLFSVAKPDSRTGIGIDQLPDSIKNSRILTGNNLAQLANVFEFPIIEPSFSDDTLKNIFQYYSINPEEMETEIHLYARKLLENNQPEAAWQVLLATT